MSLINDVLRDLDERRANDLARPDLQREIRNLPEAPRGFGIHWLAVSFVLLVAIAGGGYWWFLQRASNVPVRQENMPVGLVQPALLPLPQEMPARIDGEPVLRSDTSLASLPVPVSAPEPTVERAVPVGREKVSTQRAVVAAVSAPVAEAAGTVEKKPALVTPRDRAEADLHRAQAWLTQEKISEAGEALRSALRHDPAYSPARQLWMKLLLEQKRTEEVVGVLQEGLELQPNQTGWAMTLARLLLEKNELAAAEHVLARSYGYGAANAAYLGFYGHVRLRLGQSREAIELYQAAARLAPGEGRWWFGLGAALEAAGRSGEAREAYRQAQASGNLPAELVAITEQRVGR